MAELISKQVVDFLETLQSELRMPPERSLPIVEEVRTDLLAHIQKFVQQGNDEKAAVALALEEMGSPSDLACQMRREVPPLNGPAVRWVRRLIAILLALLAGWVLWNIRADAFGFSLNRVLATATFCLPVFLLVWPDVIWRKNWMFSLLPAVGVLFALTMLMSLGSATSASLIVSPDGPAPAPSFPPDPRVYPAMGIAGYLMLGLLGMLTIYLLGMMQQSRQRLWAICAICLFVAVVEAPYALEESYYTAQLTALQSKIGAIRNEVRAYPSNDRLIAESGTGNFRYFADPKGESYSLFWRRPLSGGYELCYSSENNRMWIND